MIEVRNQNTQQKNYTGELQAGSQEMLFLFVKMNSETIDLGSQKEPRSIDLGSQKEPVGGRVPNSTQQQWSPPQQRASSHRTKDTNKVSF